MISVIRQFSSSVALLHIYQFAGQMVSFSEPVTSLAAFKIEGAETSPMREDGLLLKDLESFSQVELLTSKNSDLSYQGQAQFDQNMRSIDYWRAGGVAQIDVDGVPSCRLDLKSQCIVILNDLAFDVPFNLELITGPALILLLAEQSIFCLHAGAISFLSSEKKQTNIAFLADSGVGKSTLSREFPPLWEQLCDDILPVQALESSVQLFNDFPQLKLDQNRVKKRVLKSNNLDCIVCLNSEVSNEVVIEKMLGVKSVLAIVRHTVASRLFDQRLLQLHCEFALSLSKKIQVYQVSYPRDYAQLPELRQRIMNAVV